MVGQFHEPEARVEMSDCWSLYPVIRLFHSRKVLDISAGIEEPGTVKWDLALCFLLAWILCYFCVWRGTRTTKKVPSPYTAPPNFPSILRLSNLISYLMVLVKLSLRWYKNTRCLCTSITNMETGARATWKIDHLVMLWRKTRVNNCAYCIPTCCAH